MPRLERLRADLAAVLDDIATLAGGPATPEAGAPWDAPRFRDLAVQLERQAKEFDTEAGAPLQAMRDMQLDARLRSAVDDITRLIERYDFEAASDAIERLAG